MLSKTQVKYIQSLFHKKFREEYGLFVIEGPKMAQEAISLVPDEIINIYACPDWVASHENIDKDLPGKLIEVTGPEMEKISGLNTPSNVLVILRQQSFARPSNWEGITILLDSIQDPGNLGTIIRTADWFGVKNIICGSGTVDCYNPKVIQSTMGSILRVHIYSEDLELFLADHPGIPVVATSLEGEALKQGENWDRLFLVIGNESQGVRQTILKKATKKLLIPRHGEAESLNAAVATGIILYALTS